MNELMMDRAAWRGTALRWTSAGVLALALAGCATGPNADPRDPLEPYNRTMFKFNDAVDRTVLKPVARGYVDYVPEPVRNSVSNFFGNLSDMWSTVNNLLQFKGQATAESALRVTTNTVFGFGGLFDIATAMGIPRHKQDFGLTLGRWGVPTGPYFMLPLLGPSTIRDTAALPVDSMGSPIGYIHDIPWRYGFIGGRVLDTRARLLPVTDVADDVALDRYLMTRDAYLQTRKSGEQAAAQYDNTDYSAEPDDGSAASTPASAPAPTQEPTQQTAPAVNSLP